MNKNHRVVWSEHRQAFVVAHEAAACRTPGPSSSAVSSVAKAVAALALSAASLQAMAACPAAVSGLITISSAVTSGCELNAGENIIINAGASLEDGYAIYGSIAGTITNNGYVHGTSDTALNFYGGATVVSIANTGTIEGLSYGIRIQNNSAVTGGVTNSGLITAGEYGVYLDGGSIVGQLSNSGTIFGDYNAIYIDSGSYVGGGIRNTGTLSSTDDQVVHIGSGSTVDGGIYNGGSIGGTNSYYDVAGINISNSTINGGITNAGTIDLVGTSEYAHGIRVDGSTVNGGITNTGYIRAFAPSSGYGLHVESSTVNGGISNSGTIIGGNVSSDFGAGLSLESASVDYIVNTGRIDGIASSSGYGIYVGSTTINGGITNSGSINGLNAGVLLNSSTIGGTLLNQQGGTIFGNAVGLEVDANSAIIEGIENAGVIAGEVNSVALNNTGAPINVVNTGTLQGNVALGLNTLNLNGPSSRVIGSTLGTGNVNVNGTFTSEGLFSVSNFAVASTGEFNQAHGVTVTGLASNAGVWNVGSGSRTITGDYSQSASGTLKLSLSSDSSYGKLHATGNATVANGSKVYVNVVGSPTLQSGTTIAGVLTTGGSLTTNASSLTVNDNSALYQFTAATVSAPGNALDLIVSADTVGLPTAVRNAGYSSAEGAAGALQTIFNEGIPAAMQPVFDRLNNLTETEAAAAVSQTLPSITGASSQAGINALHSMNKIIQSRVESVQGLSSGDGGADRYAWVRAFGNWSDQNDRGGVAGFKSDTGGLVIGADAPVNDKVRAGGAFTYAKSNIKSKSGTAPSKVEVDTFELVGYASYNIDPRTDINYQIDIGQNKASSTRDISFMGTRATADFDSVAVHGSVGIGRLMPISPATNWTPSVRLDYTQMRTEGYTEEGAGPLNLDVEAQTYREFLLTGDAKVSHQFEGGLKFLGNVSAGYDFINKQAKTTSTFTGGGPTFVTNGLDVSPWFYRVGAGLVKETGKGMEYSVRYDMEGRTSGYLNQSVSAKVRWAF